MVTQLQVSQALNNALENGYRVDRFEIRILIEDLMMYDKRFEDVGASDLVPLIEQWKASLASEGEDA